MSANPNLLVSRRNPQPPLMEPLYEFQDIPRCKKDLDGSVVIKILHRDIWMKCLAELLLLCNEAGIRNEIRANEKIEELKRHALENGNGHAVIPVSIKPIHEGKPLSLEYLADRLDLDDPMYGYMVRTKEEGWMQGFITVTQFTTWQRWFRWDSLADQAGVIQFTNEGAGFDALTTMGMHDPLNMDHHDTHWWLDRKVDGDGSLAACLNGEIRDGDPDGEGIMWPHVAELSLLGGVGCGSFLLKHLLDELENESDYHYIVLQATENSVPFYESHGFIRVGAVARYFHKADMIDGVHTHTSPSDVNGSSSNFKIHTVEQGTESIEDIIALHEVPIGDLIFMNKRAFPEIQPKTQFLKGSRVRVPVYPHWTNPVDFSPLPCKEVLAGDTKDWVRCSALPGSICPSGLWYVALENETPYKIAKKLNLDVKEFMNANKSVYKDLRDSSLLLQKTVLRVPGTLVKAEDNSKAAWRMDWGWGSDDTNTNGLGEVTTYRHWAFSDDPISASVGSYMMARPINKRSSISKVATMPDNSVPSQYAYQLSGIKSPRKLTASGAERLIRQRQGMQPCSRLVNVNIKCTGAISGPLKAAAKLVDVTGEEFLNNTEKRHRKRRGEHEYSELDFTKKVLVSEDGSTLNIFIKHGELFGPTLEAELPASKKEGIKPRQYGTPLSFFSTEVAPALLSQYPKWTKNQLDTEIVSQWKSLPVNAKSVYEIASADDHDRYVREVKEFELSHAAHHYLVNKVVKLRPKSSRADRSRFLGGDIPGHVTLYNHINSRKERKDEEFEYFFVLTYIPDLFWCRLCPMKKEGKFTDTRFKKRLGKDRWILVPEGITEELDVSAVRCIPVKSVAVNRCKDADKEEWDIQ